VCVDLHSSCSFKSVHFPYAWSISTTKCVRQLYRNVYARFSLQDSGGRTQFLGTIVMSREGAATNRKKGVGNILRIIPLG
jgi:hypothetical protein